jgi:hypothetical protein
MMPLDRVGVLSFRDTHREYHVNTFETSSRIDAVTVASQLQKLVFGERSDLFGGGRRGLLGHEGEGPRLRLAVTAGPYTTALFLCMKI